MVPHDLFLGSPNQTLHPVRPPIQPAFFINAPVYHNNNGDHYGGDHFIRYNNGDHSIIEAAVSFIPPKPNPHFLQEDKRQVTGDHSISMSENGSNGLKGNTGEFAFPTSSKSKARSRKRKSSSSSSNADAGSKIIIALIAGAGAAFLLALVMLMSRLEAEEVNNGLLNSNVGGARGVDDQIIAEEVAEGPVLMQQKDRDRQRKTKLIESLGKMKKGYDKKLKKWERMFNLPKGNPLEVLVHEGGQELAGMAKAVNGEGKMPEHHNLRKDFKDAIHRDNEKLEKRKHKRAKKKRDREGESHEEEGGDGDSQNNGVDEGKKIVDVQQDGGNGDKPPHIYPLFPPMPPHAMAEDLFGEKIITDTLSHDKPTVAGIIAILQRFLRNLHQMLVDNRDAKTPNEVIEKYFGLVTKYLEPLEETYRDRMIFPIREDNSIFMSLGAYRDHLLGETLKQAFKTAAHPDKLFVGAVVQNCFGIGVQCRTGVEVKGKDKNGRPITQVSDRPPDVNGIEQFCNDPDYTKYCDSGQIRALYVNETESNGPTTARYFASKMWGGETYFLQADAHLRFAPEWDRLYVEEVKLAKSYPKAILSSYPPGFSENDPP